MVLEIDRAESNMDRELDNVDRDRLPYVNRSNRSDRDWTLADEKLDATPEQEMAARRNID
jgi:hypothetical protein